MELLNKQNQRGNILSLSFFRRRQNFALRMAPMIDMTFLMLLFFLVAAKWRPMEDFLPFQLPGSKTQASTIGRPEPLFIRIDAAAAGCKVQIGLSQAVAVEDRTIQENLLSLARRLGEVLTEQKRYAADPVEIICGPDVKWDHLAKIYNVLYGLGLSDITFQMTRQLPNDNVEQK